jgi:hypothetical protein
VLRGAKWLADRVAISVIPSLQSLKIHPAVSEREDGSQGAGGMLLAIGSPPILYGGYDAYRR